MGGSTTNNGTRILNALNAEVSDSVTKVNRKGNGASSNSFDTDMLLPTGYQLANQVLLLENSENTMLKFVNSHLIECIEKVAGKTRIHVRFDPGVSIDPASVREVHHPRREADSARLRFVPADTTVPGIANIVPGKDPAQRINMQVGRVLETDEDIELTTIPDNAKVVQARKLRNAITSHSPLSRAHLVQVG